MKTRQETEPKKTLTEMDPKVRERTRRWIESHDLLDRVVEEDDRAGLDLPGGKPTDLFWLPVTQQFVILDFVGIVPPLFDEIHAYLKAGDRVGSAEELIASIRRSDEQINSYLLLAWKERLILRSLRSDFEDARIAHSLWVSLQDWVISVVPNTLMDEATDQIAAASVGQTVFSKSKNDREAASIEFLQTLVSLFRQYSETSKTLPRTGLILKEIEETVEILRKGGPPKGSVASFPSKTEWN